MTLVETGASRSVALIEGQALSVIAVVVGMLMLAVGWFLPVHPGGETPDTLE